MSRIIYFIVIFLFFVSCNTGNIVDQIIKDNKNHTSVHFKIKEKYYYSDGVDTTYTPYEVWAIKDKEDSLRNGYIWADNNYRPYNMIYQSGDLYLSIPPKKTTILYRDFKEDLISPVDWIDIFLKPGILQKQINDPGNKVSVLDTVYKSKQAIYLKIQFPENEKKQKISNEYIVDKKTGFPLWSMLKIASEKNIYFDKLFFSDSGFDNINKAGLTEKHKKILNENPVDIKGSGTISKRLKAMLHKGDPAPDFTGNFYSTGEDFHLKDQIGKDIIIIDFWYTHCPPCVKSMPYLSGLSKKYKDKGLKIFGLNSVDNQPRSKKYLKKFFDNRKLDYDVILINPEVDIKYKINGYPTMYMIDKSGKIAFAELGFDKKKFKELEKKVGEIINE